MKMNKTTFFLMLLPFLCYGQQTTVIIPSDFIETAQPMVGSSDWSDLIHSDQECAVSIVHGMLEVRNPFQNRNACMDEDDCYCKLEIRDGILKGKNWGEWGGELYYEPTDVKKLNIIIKKGNIQYIFEYNHKLYFIEGLAHLGMSSGALFELNRTRKKFKYHKIFDFEDAPAAFTFFDGKLLIAGNRNFYVLDQLKKELVFKDMFWSGLYPNSVAALDEKNVFIGIRSGIVKLDLIEKKATFYKKN